MPVARSVTVPSPLVVPSNFVPNPHPGVNPSCDFALAVAAGVGGAGGVGVVAGAGVGLVSEVGVWAWTVEAHEKSTSKKNRNELKQFPYTFTLRIGPPSNFELSVRLDLFQSTRQRGLDVGQKEGLTAKESPVLWGRLRASD